jgi:hypothetical protein
LYAIDVVHKDFCERYLDEHVKPFASEFGRLALKHHEILASGKGFASGLRKNWLKDLEPRLRVRNATAALVRGRELAKNIGNFPKRFKRPKPK